LLVGDRLPPPHNLLPLDLKLAQIVDQDCEKDYYSNALTSMVGLPFDISAKVGCTPRLIRLG
jgi:hypothetical protein